MKMRKYDVVKVSSNNKLLPSDENSGWMSALGIYLYHAINWLL